MDARALQHAELVGELAQDIFNAFVEKTWTVDVRDIRARIVQADGVSAPTILLVIGEDDEDDDEQNMRKSERAGGGWYFKFRSEARQEVLQRQREAMLAHGNSIWQLVVMSHIVKMLFTDHVENPDTDIKEVTHAPNPALYRVIQHITTSGKAATLASQPYPDDQAIGVFQIKLRTGLKVALSLTGGQYTHEHTPVRPWDQYTRIYSATPSQSLTSVPLGTAQEQHNALLSTFPFLSVLHIHKIVLAQLTNALEHSGMNRHLVSMLNVVETSGQAFNKMKSGFLSGVHALLISITNLISPGLTTMPSVPLAHPREVSKSIFWRHGRTMRLYDWRGSLGQYFDWERIRSVAKDPSMGLALQREARMLLKTKSMIAPWGDSRIMTLEGKVVDGELLRKGWVKNNGAI